MKQPELGKKILELRKAKGLTQEALVELCNINVRTIQRIEAGEVTPRPFTIKAILEVLGFDVSTIQEEEIRDNSIIELENGKNVRLLRMAFFIGIVYFLLTFAEMPMDLLIMESGVEAVPPFWYVFVKVAVIFTFTCFIYGYYRLSTLLSNFLIKGASIMLIVGILISNSADILSIFIHGMSVEFLQFSKSVLFGSFYVVFGIGLINYQKAFGSVALVAGCLAIASGLMFITVILALPGLFVFTVFEILQLILLYNSSEIIKNTSLFDKSGLNPVIG